MCFKGNLDCDTAVAFVSLLQLAFYSLHFCFQLECIACGHSWYAARDAVSMLTIDAPSSNKNVGTAPLATAKFEDVEKKLVSPRESDKAAAKDTLKKTTEAFMPVLDAQRSFSKSRKEENSESTKKAE